MSQAVARTLPHSLEAEEYLLSCCLLDGAETVRRCLAAKLAPGSFYDPKHGVLFDCMAGLYERQVPIDIAVVAEELKTSGRLDQVGGVDFLGRVSKLSPTTAQVTYFIAKVREQAMLRELIWFGTGLVENVYGFSGGDMADWLSPQVDWLHNALVRVVHEGRAGLTLTERIAGVKEAITARADGTEDKSGWIHVGMPEFERFARPLGSDPEDHIVLVGGASGHGKSALMRQWAGQALANGQVVLNYTRETSVNGWIMQMGANWARVNLKALHEVPKDHVARLHAACDRLTEYASRSLFVFQQEAGTQLLTIEDWADHVRAWCWEHGAPHLVVIDYLQLFGCRARMGNREQEVAHVSHMISAVQRELGFVCLVGAQLNETGLREMRTPKKDDNGRLLHRLPCAGDFRESQAIYHDADRVVAIYRPPEGVRGAENYGLNVMMPEMWLCQIKRRYGGEGSVKCWFEKPYLNFREFTRAEAAAASVPAETKASLKADKTR